MSSIPDVAIEAYKFSLVGDEYTRQNGTSGGRRLSKRLITIPEWADLHTTPGAENVRILAAVAVLRRLERPDLSDPVIAKALLTPDGRNLRARLEGRDNPDDLVTLRREVKRLLLASVPALALPEGGALASPDPFFLSGLCTTDIDLFDGPNAAAEREEVWQQMVACPHIPAAGGSASGQDFWALMAIPKAASIPEFKRFYWGMLELFQFLRMRQQKGQDNVNRERYVGVGRIHVRDMVAVPDREMLLDAYAASDHASKNGYKRVTPGFTPEDADASNGADDRREQDGGGASDWWGKAISDMVNKVHGNKHRGIYQMGLATYNYAGDYDEYLEKAIAAGGDVGVDASEVDRQFKNGYEYGEQNPPRHPRGRPSARQDVRTPFSGEGVAECLTALGYHLRWNNRALRPEVQPFTNAAKQQATAWNYGISPRQPNGWVHLDDGKEAVLHDLIKKSCRHAYGAKPPVDFAQKNGRWVSGVDSWCETHYDDPFLEDLKEHYDGDDNDDPGVWVEWFRGGYLLKGTHSDDYLAYAARWIIIPCIARAYEPGVIADTITVLAGGGGMGKGRGLSELFPARWRQHWFTDALDFRLNKKELVEAMSGFVLGELAELSYLTRTEIGASKQLISRVAEKGVRLAYARRTQNYYRTWHLVGTTNNDGAMGFLPDTENLRRYIIVNLPELSAVEAKALAEHVSRWTEKNARRLWNQGLREYHRHGSRAYTYDPPKEVVVAIRENNRVARKAERAAEAYADLIHAHVSREDIKGGFATVPELLEMGQVMTRRGRDGEIEYLTLEEIISDVDRRGPAFVRSIGTELRTAGGWEASRITRGPFKGRTGYRPKPTGGEDGGEDDHPHQSSPGQPSANP